jgi:hypothetical protein
VKLAGAGLGCASSTRVHAGFGIGWERTWRSSRGINAGQRLVGRAREAMLDWRRVPASNSCGAAKRERGITDLLALMPTRKRRTRPPKGRRICAMDATFPSVPRAGPAQLWSAIP